MLEYLISLFGCFVLSFSYVLSLYIWGSRTSRNLPQTIKKRFLSCLVNMMIAPFFVQWVVRTIGFNYTISELLGFRLDGILQACLIPLILTAILFLGPISVNYMGDFDDDESFSLDKIDLVWMRNHVVAPLSEEFIYRSCILAMLIFNFTPSNAITLSSLSFGIAHVHHVFSNLYEGHNLKSAVLITGFQVLYTSLFGAYSGFLFLRTGHFVAPFLVHAFCNHMGFPNVHQVFQLSEPKRSLASFLYVFGLFSWLFLLVPATNPDIYSNNFHWKIHNKV